MDQSKSEAPAGWTVGAAMDLFQALANASAMLKIYPADHAAGLAVRAEAWAKIRDGLSKSGPLEIGVLESAFQLGPVTVYKDEAPQKSLPRLFFKDGVRSLAFRPGLAEAEFLEFLDIIRTATLLPAEESDIVNLFWAKDFSAISIAVAENFLATQLLYPEVEPWAKLVDPAALNRGKIVLTPEDAAAAAAAGSGGPGGAPAFEPAGFIAALDAKEEAFLVSLLGAERAVPEETDFLELFFELLAVEDRLEPFQAMLAFLDQHHQALLRKGDFDHAALLFRRLDEFQAALPRKITAKHMDTERAARRMREGVVLAALKDQARGGRVEDPAAFFRYLAALGERTLPLAAEVYEEISGAAFRAAALAYLEQVGRESIARLAGLISEAKPNLSRAVALLIGRVRDPRGIPFLASFKDSKNAPARLEAVRSLAVFDHPLARKLLAGYKLDRDPDVREACRKALEAREDA